jgi:hypothetical protein
MERQKKSSYTGGRYPDIRRYLRIYSRRAGLGIVVGVAATGCIWPWQVSGDMVVVDTADTAWNDTGAIPGDIGETGEVYYMVLPDTGERHLQFEDPIWGQIDYRVDLVIEDIHLHQWIVHNPEQALAAIDAALLGHPVIDFDGYTGDGIIENEIRQALADAMAGSPGADISAIRGVGLVIVHYTDENDIDGDIG